MSDLDLINWREVTRAVLQAEENRRYLQRKRGEFYEEPVDAAKRTALESISIEKDVALLRKNGFQNIGGFWCRVEKDKIATYTRESAVGRLKKENAGNK